MLSKDEFADIYEKANDDIKVQIEETLNMLQRLPDVQGIDPHMLNTIRPFFRSVRD